MLDHQLPPNTAKTIYYKKDTKHSTTNYYPEHPTGPGPHPTNFKAIAGPPGGDHPSYPPGPNTYIYREERTNTANNRYESPVPYSDYPDRSGSYPREPHHPTTVTYKYSSTTTNATRNIYPPPEEREPLLQPFPTDGIPQNEIDGNPPKRVEDLMATLGEVSYSSFPNLLGQCWIILSKIDNTNFIIGLFRTTPVPLLFATFAYILPSFPILTSIS